MPNCLGAIDGKFITIQAPINSGSEFFNDKKNFSLVSMAPCDAYYRLTLVDVGASGSNHDVRVFKNSGFGKAILNTFLDIPSPDDNLPDCPEYDKQLKMLLEFYARGGEFFEGQ
ncbi:hypothetical protein JTB14_029059 [Gonioctena quinquepunctata]|nr:hypothetical protein JTB14_029059 [Gonioctena quinquepunctata]